MTIETFEEYDFDKVYNPGDKVTVTDHSTRRSQRMIIIQYVSFRGAQVAIAHEVGKSQPYMIMKQPETVISPTEPTVTDNSITYFPMVYMPLYHLNELMQSNDSDTEAMIVFPYPKHEVMVWAGFSTKDDGTSVDGKRLTVSRIGGSVVTDLVFKTEVMVPATPYNLRIALEWCENQEKL